MNTKQLRAERAAAGAEYAKAVETFREAWACLAAIDRSLSNGNVAQGEVIRSWHFASRHSLEGGLRALQHSQFFPRILVQDWHDHAVKASDRQIEEFKP